MTGPASWGCLKGVCPLNIFAHVGYYYSTQVLRIVNKKTTPRSIGDTHVRQSKWNQHIYQKILLPTLIAEGVPFGKCNHYGLGTKDNTYPE